MPETAFGRRAGRAFAETVRAGGGQVIETYYGGGHPLPDLSAAAFDPAQRALFIPVADDAVRVLLPRLPAERRSGLSVLGTGSWGAPNIVASPRAEGVLFAAPDPGVNEAFRVRFRQLYGRTPGLPAALAYDAVRLSAALASDGGETPFAAAKLTRATGFQGVSGTFRFSAGGTSDRLPAVCAIRGRRIRVLAPSPPTFV